MKKRLAIHQPNYIPWLGFFYKMAECDLFIFLDTIQYPRGRSFAARNRIKTPNGSIFLTIPVHIPKGHEGKVLYTDIQLQDEGWKEKHLKTLLLNYKRAPYFEEIYQIYKSQINRYVNLVDLNIGLISAFADYLNITTKTLRLSEILKEFGQKTQLIIDICKKCNTNEYLSGTGGGRDYNNEEQLNQHGIQLIYSEFSHPQYPQLWDDFESHLSIIDLLFNCGKSSINILLQKK